MKTHKEQSRLGERNKKIAGLFLQHIKMSEIAKEFNLSLERIRQIGLEHGLKSDLHNLRQKKKMLAVAYLRNGKSDEYIGQKLKVSKTYCYLQRAENNIATLWQERTAARNKKIIQLLNQNVPAKKICALMNLTQAAIYVIAKKHGIFLRQKNSRVPLIRELLKSGLSVPQIAARLKITTQAVYIVKWNMAKGLFD